MTIRAICLSIVISVGSLTGITRCQQVAVPAIQIQPPANSQIVAGPQMGAVQTGPTPFVPGAEPGGATPAGGPPQTDIDQLRLQLLLAAKFDRSTPAVLKAWSKNPQEAEPEKPMTSGVVATVKNVFEDFVFLEFEKLSQFKIGDAVELAGENSLGTWKLLSLDGRKATAKWTPPNGTLPASTNPMDTNGAQTQSTDRPEPTVVEATNAGNQTGSTGPTDADSVDQSKHNHADVDDDLGRTGEETHEPDDENSPPTAGTNSTAGGETADASAKSTEKSGEGDSKSDQSVTNEEITPLTGSGGDGGADDGTKPVAEPSIPSPIVGSKVTVRPAGTGELKPDLQNQAKKEVDAFVRNVTTGNWTEIQTFLAGMKVDSADKVYQYLLTNLAKPPQDQQPQPLPGTSQPYLTPDDILQLADASPKEIKLFAKKPQSETAIKSVEESQDPFNEQSQTVIVQTASGQIITQNIASNSIAHSPDGVATGEEAANPEADIIGMLALLMKNAIQQGQDFAAFHERIKQGTRYFGGPDLKRRLSAAQLMYSAGLLQYVEEFLPPLDNETSQQDVEALKIWSQLALAMYKEKTVADWLKKAWSINQSILAIDDVDPTDREQATANLVELSSKVEKEIGVEWLNTSFTEHPRRGMSILANLGTKSAEMILKAAQVSDDERLALLRLQNEAVEKMLVASPERGGEWQRALTLLATNWLKEASIALQYSPQNSRSTYMNIDMYGNYYWVDEDRWRQQMGGNQIRPIAIGNILEIAPSQQWQDVTDASLHIHLQKTKADLYLRINEEDQAFPYIEGIANTHPVIARDLVHQFLRIWTQNHDPNSDRRQRNPYIYFYGFDQKADAIPLTRSKQERNLQELAGWVTRIRALPIEQIDEELLANAFVTCHSSAEVFKLERFESVFGDLTQLKPETIASLCERMRSNLADQWRGIRNQEQKQTKRREPEVQQEVLRGYQVGLDLAERGLSKAPESWALHLAKAKLMYDQNAYSQSVQKSSEFSDRRDEAFEKFKLAAEKYRDVVTALEKEKQSTDVYDYWFYAALGACDLGKVTEKTVPDLRQYARIREAINSLPGELAESHMAKFANNLFSRMSPIAPEIKFRYLRGGFDIVGDHPRAWEARSLFDYYKDLLHEIEFAVEIDGEDVIGHSQPFGAYINIVHTAEIERESGGFGKYVQNQTLMYFAYNYGRPNEDYRDKFSDAVHMALEEHFEVLNITFQTPEGMESRPADKPGWRVTPYAYLLLKPKGPEVDRLPSLKLDLDFLDTSGYVVIPIESPAVVIDCTPEKGPLRPVSDLKITQTLDERQADEGQLIVEVSATSKGLVPELDQIIDLRREGFTLVSVDDQGVSPTSFDTEGDGIQILSDRSWRLEYAAKQDKSSPSVFAFAEPKMPDVAAKFQRYEDADLVEVSKEVALEKKYAANSWRFLKWLVPLVAIGLFAATGLVIYRHRPKKIEARRFFVPAEINPFTVWSLLQDIKTRNGIDREQGNELQETIQLIERSYFADQADAKPTDLAAIARRWVETAK